MKQFSGYENASKAARSTGGRLPAGGYICKIMDVKSTEPDGDKSGNIKIMFDIVEGEYKDFFKKQYDNNTSEDRKWKGTATIWCPKDDGSERDSWTKNAFASWTNGLEDSNEGYRWDWDENKWKGKMIGIVFGETGTVIDGKEIVYTEARRGASVEDIRKGNFREQKFKKKNGYTGTGGSASTPSGNDWMNVDESKDEEGIPF